MTDTPVTLVVGPRQSGKTTLVKHLLGLDAAYLTLDDETTFLSATNDPAGFIQSLKDAAIIDEIQRAPMLLQAIKRSVDENRKPGSFLITGSANVMVLPRVTESLAGRMETLALLPLSQGEIHGVNNKWIDMVFAGQVPVPDRPLRGSDLVEAVLCGGYPEVLSRSSHRRRSVWIKQYLDALIQRDVQDIANVEKLTMLPQFLRALSLAAGQLCNYARLGAKVGLDHKTSSKYMTVFEQMFILSRIETWAANRLKRIVKTPKLQFLDSGVLAYLLGLTPSGLQDDRSAFGSVLETFVFSEILKHQANSEENYYIYHYRDHDKNEVDIVIENARGDIIGVEVKAGSSLSSKDLQGLLRLGKVAGKHFKGGLILHDGERLFPLGNKISSAPVSSLWAG